MSEALTPCRHCGSPWYCDCCQNCGHADCECDLERVEATCDWYDHAAPRFDSEEQAEQHAEELRDKMRGIAA